MMMGMAELSSSFNASGIVPGEGGGASRARKSGMALGGVMSRSRTRSTSSAQMRRSRSLRESREGMARARVSVVGSGKLSEVGDEGFGVDIGLLGGGASGVAALGGLGLGGLAVNEVTRAGRGVGDEDGGAALETRGGR